MNLVLNRRLRSPVNAGEPAQGHVIPFGNNGGGEWTGHPIGAVIAVGVALIALIGVPPIRAFFFYACLIGMVVGVLLWKRHRHALYPDKITPIGELGGGLATDHSMSWIVGSGVLLIAALLSAPLVKLFVLFALPPGAVVGLFLWWRQARNS